MYCTARCGVGYCTAFVRLAVVGAVKVMCLHESAALSLLDMRQYLRVRDSAQITCSVFIVLAGCEIGGRCGRRCAYSNLPIKRHGAKSVVA